MTRYPISRIEGSGVSIMGNDIDTDQIVPARYLKEITFENMGNYLFYDARYTNNTPTDHPLNQPQFAEAKVMVVNTNFGCGSSREHAPQAIKRAGFDALIGESFAEIFSGNCKALGMITAVCDSATIHRIQDHITNHPSSSIRINIESEVINVAGIEEPLFCQIKPAHQRAFLDGTWDALSVLKDNQEHIQQVAKTLPYFNW